MSATITVPEAEAHRICAELRARRRWYHLALWQCWGCAKYSGGDPAKMCGQVVGCNQVVARYRRQPR